MIFNVESDKWHLVHLEKDHMKAEMIKTELELNEISTIVVNKKDSNYPIFGVFEMYVPKDLAEISMVVVQAYLNKSE